MRLYDTCAGKCPTPGRWFMNVFLLCTLLYIFILGLSLMGNAFKGVSGVAAGELMGAINNPIAGLGLGVLVTVLLQSSSTTTSIVVTMVGADIVTVQNAIPLIMGANIGTSVTNTMVAHGHVRDKEEFRRGFEGATVHDAFNILTVLVLLPIEVITQAFGAGLLKSISSALADGLVGAAVSDFESPLDYIVGPVSKSFIKINKNLIKGIAKGCHSCTPVQQNITSGVSYCLDDSRKDSDGEKIKQCVTQEEWQEIYHQGRIVKGGFAKGMGDVGGSIVVLIISLVFLCFALYWIVRLLHHLVLSSGRAQMKDGGDTPFVRLTKKILKSNPYVLMLFGMVMTIVVQSSSIITSTLTPLVAIGIMSLEEMLALTLGANIGTTCTAFLASIVTEKKSAIQIALCHLFFNIIGILIWFPLPFMRRAPLAMARTLGARIVRFRWFGAFYILLTFVAGPLLLFAFSLSLELGAGGIVLNIILDIGLVAGVLLLIAKFDVLADWLCLGRISVRDKGIGKVDDPGVAGAQTEANGGGERPHDALAGVGPAVV